MKEEQLYIHHLKRRVARGLLRHDQEWFHCMQEAADERFPWQIRDLFTTILLYCEPTSVLELWNRFEEHMIEDFENYPDHLKVTKAAKHINRMLLGHRKQWTSYNLPEVNFEALEQYENENEERLQGNFIFNFLFVFVLIYININSK